MKQITKQYKLLYFLLILLSLTSALLMTFFSLQLGRILDSISNSNSGLLFHITICVSLILLWFLISCSYSYLKNQYVKKVILDLKRRLLLHYLSREFNQIDNRNHSDFLNNITKNSDLIQENLLIPKISLIANLGSLIMSVVAIIYIEWRLALVFLLLSSITIFLSQIPGKLMTKSTNNYSLQNNHYLSKMTNFINGFEQIKLLNIQSWTQEKIQEISLEFEESRKTYQFLKDLASTTGILLSFGSQLSCMVAGIFFVRNNLLTIGLLVASIQLLNGVFAPLQSILYNKNLISSSKSIIDNIQENLYETNHELFHKTRTIDCDNISTISISQLHYEIENKILFDHFSYEFKKGKRYAIIGASGAGKTTLVKLILNYYSKNLYDGEIKINGKQNIDIPSEELYKDIAFVQKNDFLIEGNILENIKLSRNLYLTEKLRKALGFSEDFLNKSLSQSNQTISEGEKQRIDLARFLAKPYSVYIFDEPTSNLDPIKAKAMMDYILSIKDAIVIVITHDQNPKILEEFDHVITL